MGRKSSDQEVADRREWLLDAIGRIGWHSRLRREYQRRFGLSDRQAYADRKAILEALAEGLDEESVPERRAEFVERLRLLQARCVDQNQWVSAIRAMGLEAKVLGLLEHERHLRISGTPEGLSIRSMAPQTLEAAAWDDSADDDAGQEG